jgi:hypothetical protein
MECVKTRDDHRRRGYVTVIPLEANHSSCHYATKIHRSQIDGESINSVGLEEEQHCNYRHLLYLLHLVFIFHKHDKLYYSSYNINAIYIRGLP